MNSVKRRGARRWEKPVNKAGQPRTSADKALVFHLRAKYHRNDGSPQFAVMADEFGGFYDAMLDAASNQDSSDVSALRMHAVLHALSALQCTALQA